MLRPLGETPIATTSAPSSHSAVGRDLVGGAVGAIDHDLEPVEPQMLGKGRLGEVDVAAARVVDPLGPADLLGASTSLRLASRAAARSPASSLSQSL